MKQQTRERLLAIAAEIVRHEKQFDMNDFGEAEELSGLFQSEKPTDVCGTSCCIAGFAYALYGKFGAKSKSNYVKSPNCVSRRILGITEEQSARLFYSNKWVDPFHSIYSICYSKNDTKVAALRIKFFVATNGTDDVRKFKAERIGGEFQTAQELIEEAEKLEN